MRPLNTKLRASVILNRLSRPQTMEENAIRIPNRHAVLVLCRVLDEHSHGGHITTDTHGSAQRRETHPRSAFTVMSWIRTRSSEHTCAEVNFQSLHSCHSR